MSKTRLMTAGAIAAAGLVLSGCAGATPGAAAVIGDDTISVKHVDALAESLCVQQEAQVEAQGGAVPMLAMRQNVLAALTFRTIAEQIADEHGLKPGSTYESARGQEEALARTLPKEIREDYLEIATSNAFATDILTQAGRAALVSQGVEDPTPDEAAQAGGAVFGVWLSENSVEFDPRYGIAVGEGQLERVDTNVSIPVSETAVATVSQMPDPAYALTLPESQRCGG